MLSNLLEIKIDFNQSHLFFPKIIITILAVLIFIQCVNLYRKSSFKKLAFFDKNCDKRKLFGSIALIIIYFKAIHFISDLFPNTGYGFLISSIIFMACISILFIGVKDRKKLVVSMFNSIITPSAAWFLFGYLFNITLP